MTIAIYDFALVNSEQAMERKSLLFSMLPRPASRNN